MHPSYEQFLAALRDPAQRAGIRLIIDQSAAESLLSRSDWAADYYQQWIALFPSAAPAAVVPVLESPYGPPPTAAPSAPAAFSRDPSAASYTAQVWPDDDAGRIRRPSRGRLAIIVLSALVGALLLVVAGFAIVSALPRTPVSALSGSSAAPSTEPSTGPTAGADTDADQVFFHGLTRPEYDLLEATVEATGHSLEEGVAQGTTDAVIRALADQLDAQTAKICTSTKDIPNGFANTTYRSTFISGFETTSHADEAHAAAVYDAIEEYCGATP